MSEPSDANLGTIAEFTSTPLSEGADYRAYRYYLQAGARRLLPNSGLCRCMRRIVPEKRVEIHHSEELQKAGYKNLQQCTLVHVCPICSGIISRQRQIEMQLAVDYPGTSWVMLTYTMRHTAREKLRTTLTAMCRAYSAVHSGRKAVFLHEVYGWVGSIRVFEITHGAKGWHFHFHELVCRWDSGGLVWDALETDMRESWDKALGREGRDCNQHGFTLSDKREDIAEYLSKYGHLPAGTWNGVEEVLFEQMKNGRQENRTPWQLLDDYIQGDKSAGKLFQEYGKATRRKQKVVWSKGLRDKLNVTEDRVESALADTVPDDYQCLAILSLEDWKLVLRGDHRAELLRIADMGDVKAVRNFLDSLIKRRRRKPIVSA